MAELSEKQEARLVREASSWNVTPADDIDPDPLPTLDFGPFLSGQQGALEQLSVELRAAAETTGFFYVYNHSVPAAITAGVFAASTAFHDLPAVSKREIAEVDGMGYLEHGHKKLPRREHGNKNAAVLFKRGTVATANGGSDKQKNTRLITLEDNMWPSSVMLPKFRRQVEAYALAAEQFARKLITVYAVALKLPETFFDDAIASPMWRLRLTHYPAPETEDESPGYGIAPHVDTSFFTLLAQDNVAGLVVCRPDGQWRRVRPNAQFPGPGIPQQPLLVNTGELLRMWSNDVFKSTKHYVLPTPCRGRGRYSVPFFFNVDSTWRMECLPSCTDSASPPKYQPMSYLESQGVAQGE